MSPSAHVRGTADMTSSGAVLAPPSGRYVIDPAGSPVAFVTRHMLGLGRVRGTLRVAGGLVAIADRPEDSRVEAEIAASSFSTGNVIRDRQVCSRLFLDVRRHPVISLCSDGIHQHPKGWSWAGTLTVRGGPCPSRSPHAQPEPDQPPDAPAAHHHRKGEPE